jgi:alanyl-tRNA synthetase
MPNTERLYYADPYQREFSARVIARRGMAGQPAVALDRTAFYPTGGGQPHDTGRLLPAGTDRPAARADEGAGVDVDVLDVIAEDGLIWHILSASLAADEVRGALDWSRRFDHMQQHTGQHILSQAFIRAYDAETVAFHLGAASSTIDLDRTDLGAEALARVETAANAIVDAALTVSPAFVPPEALASIPLRKPPKVTEDIRIVEVAGLDWSACGGTHVANTAQVGLIKITATERRGSELRVAFLCGERARADYARLLGLAQGLVARFSTAQDDLLAAVDRRAAEMQALRKELTEMEGPWIESTAAALWSEAGSRGAWRVVTGAVDYPFERAKRIVQALRARPGAVVLLGVRGERPQLIFARADDVALDAGALLRTAVTAAGGRGGGRPDFAQGGVQTNAVLNTALQAALLALPKD